MTNKHTATLPDGTVATRNSKARTYTHAVAIGPKDPARYAAEVTSQIAATRAKIATIEAALVNPTVHLQSRGYSRVNEASDFNSHEAYLTGAFTRVRGKGRAPSYLTGEPNLRSNYAGEFSDKFNRFYDLATWTGKTITDQYGDTIIVAPVLEGLILDANRAIAQHAKEVARLEALLVAIEDGTADLGSWGVLAWAGRPDLAEKEAARYRAYRPAATVVLVEAVLS